MWSIFNRFRSRNALTVARRAVKRRSATSRAPLRLEALEDRYAPATLSSIASNFNGTAIPSGDTLWFASVLNVTGVGSNAVTINVTNQTITFTDSLHSGTPYTLAVPNAVVTLSASATSATTTFNTSLNEWVTTAPTSMSGNVFLAGLSWAVPSGGLGGSDNPVTWSGQFSTDTAGVSLNWQWGAAAYTSFSTTYSSVGVKPCDSNTASSYNNSDHAGTPESYKTHVTGGARGSGSPNYTGSYSSTAAVTPTVQSSYITGTVYNDANGDGVQQSTELGLSGWTVQLYTETSGVLSSSPLQTTTSDTLGGYSFSNMGALATGTSYVVAEVPPTGWTQTNPTSSTSGTTVLPSGQIGYVYPVSDGSVLLNSGGVNTSISGTGVLKITGYTDTEGTVTYNDGVGDSGSGLTVFSQLPCTFTPASGSPISFYTYCIDLFHDVYVGQAVNVYVGGNESTAYVNGSRMAYIYEMYGAQNLTSNPIQGAAVQLALWDLSLNNHNPTTFGLDTDGTYSSGDESVFSASFSSPSIAAPVVALVQQYLQASIGSTMQGGWFNAAANGTGSNRGQSMPIPGPEFNFGNVQPVTISGLVYQDTNGNGVLNTGEPGISGVTLTLSGTNSLGQAVTATTTTATNGTYSFSTDSNGNALLPGTYQVAETLPSGYQAGTNAVGTVNGTSDGTLLSGNKIGSIVMTSGQSGINYNFGDLKPVTIGGTVYQDSNGNGALDSGEPGIAGVTLTLSGTNGLGQAITATATTDANGRYSFSTDSNGNVLLPGTYQVAETLPSGYQAGTNAVGTVNGTSDGTLLSGNKIGSIGMTSGQAGINYNFGDLKPVTISGLVYQDTNGNGALDSGEPGISGVTLTLSGTNGLGQAITDTVTTAVNGTFSFTTDSHSNVLLPGTYQVAETLPTGYLAGTNAVGTVNGSADGTLLAGNKIGSIVMTSGQSGINYNFGDVQPVTISGTVYQDTNGNGMLDSGEPGIGSVSLTLSGTNGLGQAITATTTTATNGTYSFSTDSNGNVLLPGTYQVAETQPTGYLAGSNTVGTVNGSTDGTLLSGNKIGSIGMTSGQSGINYNFGELKGVTISGLVYQDTNGNGALDSGEPGISGVTLTLSWTNGQGQSVSVTTTTATNGTYSFSTDSNGNSLSFGTYQVAETLPGGYLAGINAVGTVNGTSDGTLLSGNKIGSIVLTQGQSGINYNFGDLKPVTISGTVYLDSNANGVLDSGDSGIAGVTLTLSGTNGMGQAITATTTTGTGGTYTFTTDSNSNPLLPGTYQIVKTPPAGYLEGAYTVGTVNGTTDGTAISADKIGSIGMTSGQSGINYNFGEVLPVTISGVVYQDTNSNGVLDSGEPGVANVTMTLKGTNNLGQSVTVTTTTAADGTYSFTTDSSGKLLAPGTYQITETTPFGYVAVAANVGTVNGTLDGTKASPSNITSIGLGSAQNGINYDFGLSIPAAVSGYVYLDYNRDQTFDSGDGAFANQIVNIVGTNVLGQSVNLSVTTDANGYYIFANLLAGMYTITLTAPGGIYTPDAANVGTVNGNSVGLANTTTNLEIDQVQLYSGNNGVNYDFGVEPPRE